MSKTYRNGPDGQQRLRTLSLVSNNRKRRAEARQKREIDGANEAYLSAAGLCLDTLRPPTMRC